MTETVVGVDVSVRRGLDVVVLDGAAHVAEARSRVDPSALRALLEEWKPVAVAIDSPPGPGCIPGASSRRCERDLRDLGINIFLTPSDPDRYAGQFYDWIRVGERTFEAARHAGYPLQDASAIVRNRSLEVFPHASDAFLRGCLPPAGTTRQLRTKRAWRLSTLHAAGIETDPLCLDRMVRPTGLHRRCACRRHCAPGCPRGVQRCRRHRRVDRRPRSGTAPVQPLPSAAPMTPKPDAGRMPDDATGRETSRLGNMADPRVRARVGAAAPPTSVGGCPVVELGRSVSTRRATHATWRRRTRTSTSGVTPATTSAKARRRRGIPRPGPSRRSTARVSWTSGSKVVLHGGRTSSRLSTGLS